MSDFTLQTFSALLKSLLDAGYVFRPYCEFIDKPPERFVILRHDVDELPGNSLKTAEIESKLGIRGAYYFRILPKSNHPATIRDIAALGHEIGYHYEDLAFCKGNMDEAIKNFEKNLSYFRQFGSVKTICMHGSPLNRYDNRELWDKYNYRNFGITGEPYFDLDFTKVLYLTDTGRRWNGEKVSIRDKVETRDKPACRQGRGQGTREHGFGYKGEGNAGILKQSFHSTFDIIKAANNNTLPNQIMITVHPQRWTNHPLLWTKELVMQNLKNVVKRAVVKFK